MPVVVPMLSYEDAGAAADWLVRAFGFSERHRFADQDGTVTHVELALGDGVVMLGSPPGYVGSRRHRERCAVARTMYETPYDVDAHAVQARRAGAEILSEPADQPQGDRIYRVEDFEGHRWMFATHLRDTEPEEWGATSAGAEA
jgi:uncharacterized glyoxalase superfamily protein PhnB